MAGEAAETFTPPAEVTISPPEGYTQEEWSGLSDAEREGILDSITNPEVDEIDETTDEIDEGVLAKIAGEEKPTEEAAAATPEAKTPEVAEPVAPPPSTEPQEPGLDLSAVVPVSDADLLGYLPPVAENEIPAEVLEPDPEILAERDTKLAEAKTKFTAGELDADAYQEARDDIRDDYNRQIWNATAAAKAEAIAEIRWNKEQFTFLSAKPEYMGEKQEDGTYKRTEKSDLLYGALGQAIGRMETQKPGLTGMRLLIEADKLVKRVFSPATPVAPVAASSPAVAKPKEVTIAEGKPAAPIPDVKSLSDIPSAAPTLTDDGWGTLDKLYGQAYEDALERLTPAQRDAYLRAK
jgi:hypothetical protein